jgi:hypothetical protein
MGALREIAVTVAADTRRLRAEHAIQALAAGASWGDVKLALIASDFCMYNRMVDGLKARTSSIRRSTKVTPFSLLRWDTGWADLRPQTVAAFFYLACPSARSSSSCTSQGKRLCWCLLRVAKMQSLRAAA